jgi:hypothetical protein
MRIQLRKYPAHALECVFFFLVRLWKLKRAEPLTYPKRLFPPLLAAHTPGLAPPNTVEAWRSLP